MMVSDTKRRAFWKTGFGNLDSGKSNFNSNNSNDTVYGEEEFNNVAGKGKLCKAAGLTGSEKRACAKNIVAKCKKKPFCVGLLSRKCKDRKAKWEACASAQVVSPEQAAQDAAEKLVPKTDDAGMGLGVKLMIGAAVVGTVALIGFAISNRIKANRALVVTTRPVATSAKAIVAAPKVAMA